MLLLILLICLLPSSSCTAAHSRQKRAWIIDSYEIEEANPGPFPYVLGTVAIDRKYRVLFNLKGQGVDEDPTGVLEIEESTGRILVHKPVDFEEHQVLKLSFEAKKPEDQSIDTRLGVEIAIRDINDNPPLFQELLYEVTVDEAFTQGSDLHTVLANDKDKPNTHNSTFHYAIKSVHPESSNIEFVLKETGALSFKGCFDHQEASKHTLVIEAIDHGEVVQLTGSTTVVIHVEDGNNNLPVIIGQTGSGKVKENEIGVAPLRLHVMDKDMTQSKAWRAKYTTEGDEEGHFKIETDPETNDGILTVVKPFDFEDGAMRELKISVQNEEPYFSCKVKRRSSEGLWDVDFTKEQIGGRNIQHDTTTVFIEVEDVNDPPNFEITDKEIVLREDVPIGTWLEKMTAVDRDTTASRDFIYKIRYDPARWMNIDPQTGDITTRDLVDRESHHVVNGVYTLILHAVDKGEPPMTGTATLQVHLIDVNDNLPKLEQNYVDACMSSQYPTNISATDLDDDPYGGPFKFELVGNVKRKWKLDPSYGDTAGLVRYPDVNAGHYILFVKVSDRQGEYGISKLIVTVCSCSMVPHCRNWKPKTISHSSAVGIAFVAVAFFLLALLAIITFSTHKFIPTEDSGLKGSLMTSNTEAPGGTFESGESAAYNEPIESTQNIWKGGGNASIRHNYSTLRRNNVTRSSTYRSQGGGNASIRHNYSTLRRNNVTRSSTYRSQTEDLWSTRSNQTIDEMIEEMLFSQLMKNLSRLQEPMAELHDYEPQTYAEEGELRSPGDLDYLDVPECFSFEFLENFGPQFSELAACALQTTETKTTFTQHTV